MPFEALLMQEIDALAFAFEVFVIAALIFIDA